MVHNQSSLSENEVKGRHCEIMTLILLSLLILMSVKIIFCVGFNKELSLTIC